MASVNINQQKIDALKRSQDVARLLGGVAENVKSRVVLPTRIVTVRRGKNRQMRFKSLRLQTRFGVAKTGRYREAFSQVQMFGEGAIGVEFGTKHSPAQAPLRKALGTSGVATRVKVI